MIERLVRGRLSKTFYGNSGPYLTRYKLLDLGKSFIRVYVNQFHRSDEDREFHSHPWDWSLALILRGGYMEYRPNEIFERRPGTLNFIRHDTFHRVELLEGESWSLFIAGPERFSWFFMDPETGERWPWRDFIRRKGLMPLDH